jgi:hypothetical protein
MSEHQDRMLRIGRLLQQLDEMQRQMATVMKVVKDLRREARLSAQLTRAAFADARPRRGTMRPATNKIGHPGRRYATSRAFFGASRGGSGEGRIF